MEITSGMVKELREKTGAGLMDCKAALTSSRFSKTSGGSGPGCTCASGSSSAAQSSKGMRRSRRK